jgi:hypothetical protein
MECVESMVFDARGQIGEGGMQFYDNVISYRKDGMLFHLGY